MQMPQAIFAFPVNVLHRQKIHFITKCWKIHEYRSHKDAYAFLFYVTNTLYVFLLFFCLKRSILTNHPTIQPHTFCFATKILYGIVFRSQLCVYFENVSGHLRMSNLKLRGNVRRKTFQRNPGFPINLWIVWATIW